MGKNLMDKKVALVTNVLDYVGPPAVTALIAQGYQVVAQDTAFQETGSLHAYQQQINMMGAFHTGTIIKFAGGWPAAPIRPI